uniref:condensation domain-containing protein n=1 Tax=Streptomyces galbus TaxID=33898 RepID=UPI00383A2F91
PIKDMSRTALFDVLFQYDERSGRRLRSGDIAATLLETNLGHGKYDLHLQLYPEGEGFQARLAYNADFFDAWLIEQMMGHFVRLLRAGADLRAADRQGGTPLLIAAQINDTASVLAFLKAGADPHARDRAGATFQRYLYMSDERLLKGEAKRDLGAIQDWLREHNIAIEDGVQT